MYRSARATPCFCSHSAALSLASGIFQRHEGCAEALQQSPDALRLLFGKQELPASLGAERLGGKRGGALARQPPLWRRLNLLGSRLDSGRWRGGNLRGGGGAAGGVAARGAPRGVWAATRRLAYATLYGGQAAEGANSILSNRSPTSGSHYLAVALGATLAHQFAHRNSN